MNRRVEAFVLWLFYLSAVGGVLLVNIVFWWAFFSPHDAALVTVNEYGEKWFEVPVMIAWSVVVWWGLWIKIKRKLPALAAWIRGLTG